MSARGLVHHIDLTVTNKVRSRAFYDAIEPHAHGSHLLNFNSEAADAVVRASFGDHFARLAEVKRRYDPTNLFRQDLDLRTAA